jgi:AmpE protein
MALLAIIIVVVLVQYWGSGGPIQRDDWYLAWQGQLARLTSLAPGGWGHLLVAVAVPTVLLHLLEGTVEHSVWGLLDLLLSVAVLLYSLGRGNLGEDLRHYVERWDRGDTQAIIESLYEHGEQAPDGVDDPESLHRTVRTRLYLRGFERLFAVLFWFVLAGPAGALLYRLVRLYPEQAVASARRDLLFVLDWVPARLTALSFAIIGDFERCWGCFKGLVWDTAASTEQLLERCGNSSLGIDPVAEAGQDADRLATRVRHQVEAIELLFRRSLLLWLAVIAVLVVAF